MGQLSSSWVFQSSHLKWLIFPYLCVDRRIPILSHQWPVSMSSAEFLTCGILKRYQPSGQRLPFSSMAKHMILSWESIYGGVQKEEYPKINHKLLGIHFVDHPAIGVQTNQNTWDMIVIRLWMISNDCDSWILELMIWLMVIQFLTILHGIKWDNHGRYVDWGVL